MLDVRRLRLLRDLAHLGTIAAVARAHAYTPSAVSQQLAALQREAGVPLLEHTGRRVGLTSAGAALVAHAEAVLAALEAADASLAAARAGLSGTVRIGAFPSAVRTLLPPALVALGREHPALDLMVTELDPVAMPAALRDQRLDVALTHDYDVVPGQPEDAVDSVPLLEETVFLAVPADGGGGEDEGGGEGDPIRGARDAAWIVGSPGTLCHTVAVRACRAAGFTPRVRHHADDFTAVLALVAAGQGVAIVPRLGAAQPPSGVRLLPLPARRRTRIAYRRGSGTHPAVAACVAALRASTEAYLRGRPGARPH
ncbi:LysR family transcriptional regulator [Rugosimonospora acidiphila]|uniref:LysR family transcriptional regulator n=1 Tax=Rugosimonospora acidiphila TaxID=556531 RepID=A0ABP9SLH6_9ACTN